MNSTPWLLEWEIKDLCQGLTQPAAQIRYLQRELALTVRRKPDGSPLVMRADIEALGKTAQKPEGKRTPNRAALVETFRKQA